MTSMNTLVCQEPKKLHWEKRQIPIPGDDEVLIKIKAVGICGTDIHAWGGNQPFFSYPRVLGHEICGEIIGLGKNILKFEEWPTGCCDSLCRLPPLPGLSERPDKLL